MNAHRSWSTGGGVVRSRGVIVNHAPELSATSFTTIDRQHQLLPAIIEERHRRRLASNGEDCQ